LLDSSYKAILSTLHDSKITLHAKKDIGPTIKEQHWYSDLYSYSKYALVVNDGKKMIYDRFSSSLTPLKIVYKNVFFVISPYTDKYGVRPDAYSDYFLVENYEGEIFFVDFDGNEYKPKLD
jgi:hypothetical protein